MVASRVNWGAAIDGTARDLLAAVEIEPSLAEHRRKSARSEAAKFLRELLADGPLPAKEVKAVADAHGLSWPTVRRAQREAGVKVTKEGMKGGWSWRLNSDERRCSSSAEGAQSDGLGTFEESELLRQPSSEPGEVVEVEV